MTGSPDFPMTAGAVAPVHGSLGGSGGPGFLTVLSADGTRLPYSTYLPARGFVHAQCLAVDRAGCAYVAGGTTAGAFTATAGAFQSDFQGGDAQSRDYEAFLMKIDPRRAGPASLLYSTLLGTDGYSQAFGVTVDQAGCAYLTGVTGPARDADGPSHFPTTPDALQATLPTRGADPITHTVNRSAFVAKLDPGLSGATSLVYSTYLGGVEDSSGNAITGDAGGNIYVTGFSQGGMPTTPGVYQGGPAGMEMPSPLHGDAFVAKMDLRRPGAASVLYLTYLGGRNVDRAVGIVADSRGNAYVTGSAGSEDFPLTADALPGKGQGLAAFVTVLDPAGARLLYSTCLRANNTTFSQSLALNSAGHLYVAGLTLGTDFPVTSDALQPVRGGAQTDMGIENAFLSVFAFGPGPAPVP